MAKSTQSTNFRKVKVEELDEENFQDDLTVKGSDLVDQDVVMKLVSEKKYAAALQKVLDPQIKPSEKVLELVTRILVAVKSNEIVSALQQLTVDEKDVLLHYIYARFHDPTDTACASFLTWHDKICNNEGGKVTPGPVMRVLTNRTFELKA